ncbi:MAG: HEAT repeat domain-containing protein [Halobacteriota archaeon]
MSDGDDETPDADSEASGADESSDSSAEDLEVRLTAAEEDLGAAETEADLDAVETTLDSIESDLESADLPEPEDEDEEGPREELEASLADLREQLEAERGPYAEDVVENIEAAKTTITDGEWTEEGESEIAAVVSDFADSVSETLDGDFAPSGDDDESLLTALDSVVEAVDAAGFDPDDDADDIGALLASTEELEAGLDDAQEWDDLEVREKLEAQGFYDVLGHVKDYPPEWSAIKVWEQRGNVDMILLALDMLESDFMEEHCLDAITRLGDDGAYDEMFQRASRRDKPGIEALGKMGDGATDAVETLLDYVDTDSDPQLQKVVFKALGEIGSEDATQALADKLVMENDNVRPFAARALGLIGDTRAIDPLADTLANDESDNVRTAAAWALRQIGTRRALEVAADYADDRSYIVQAEAERAVEALSTQQVA